MALPYFHFDNSPYRLGTRLKLITQAHAFVTRINITKRLLPLTNEAARLSVVA